MEPNGAGHSGNWDLLEAGGFRFSALSGQKRRLASRLFTSAMWKEQRRKSILLCIPLPAAEPPSSQNTGDRHSAEKDRRPMALHLDPTDRLDSRWKRGRALAKFVLEVDDTHHERDCTVEGRTASAPRDGTSHQPLQAAAIS